MSATTEDAFLGGRICIRQPAEGYRAGLDPVLLAAGVPARPGDCVLDLGTGSGVALLCLMARVAGLDAVGVERDAGVARLATDNLRLNRAHAAIVTADIAALPADLRARSFDHVMANPPYFDRRKGSAAANAGREGGRGIETPIAAWTETAIRRLKPGGSLTLIRRAEGLPELLAHMGTAVGDITVLPFAARAGRAARLVLVQAKKGAKGPFRLLSPFVLHRGPAHLRDGDDFTDEASAVLRDGRPLDLSALTGR